MLNKIRAALTDVGGPETVLAIAALGWALSTLQRVVEARIAELDVLREQITAAQAAAPLAGYPAAQDLHPLQHAETEPA